MNQKDQKEYVNEVLLIAEHLVEHAIYCGRDIKGFIDKAEPTYEAFTQLRRFLKTPWRMQSPEINAVLEPIYKVLGEMRERIGISN